jgi:PAS domain S-box-containing protein
VANKNNENILDLDLRPRLWMVSAGKEDIVSLINVNDAAKKLFPDLNTKNCSLTAFLPPSAVGFFKQKGQRSAPSAIFPFNEKYEIFISLVNASQNLYEITFIEKAEAAAIPAPGHKNAMLETIFEIIDVAVAVTDADGRVVNANSAFFRIYGWEKEEIVGHTFQKLIAPNDRQRVSKLHEKYLNGKGHSTGEIGILHANGTVYETLSTTYSVALGENGARYLITTIIDISMRKRMEKSLRLAKDEAESASRAKSAFLANMSHELRTPLNAIIGFSELITSQAFGELGNARYSEYGHDIHSSAEHLLNIINEVLDMSRIEAGGLKLTNEKTCLTEMLRYIKRMLPEIAGHKKIRVSLDIEENLPAVMVDQGMLRQAFINIAANTVKHCGDEFDVMMSANLNKDGDVVIRIGDNGPGIPPDKLAQVLQPFGQVDDAFKASKNGGGAGLGLPISKGMVEEHGGTFQIESQVDRGTVVEMTIPARRVISAGADYENLPPPALFQTQNASNQV